MIAREDHSVEQMLVRYFIIGYEERAPTVDTVDFKIDWETRHLVGPVKKRQHPAGGDRVDFGIFVYPSRSWPDISGRRGEFYRKARSLAGVELDGALGRKDLTIEQASLRARTLVDVEIDANPTVGLPITVASIPIVGRVLTVTYAERLNAGRRMR